jgi:hypothetical protein
MHSIRHELENYLKIVYPDTEINTEHTFGGKITIRMNTSEEEVVETNQRINQAVSRATLIWKKLFGKTKNPLWIISYQYDGEQFIETNDEYFFQQFTSDSNSKFISTNETVNSGMISFDQNGNEYYEKIGATISIGKFPIEKINIENILIGIANRDNGQDPKIGQSVYFLDPENNTGFHLYDDRGFFVWADEPDPLREIYETYSDWISEDTREDIEEYFT